MILLLIVIIIDCILSYYFIGITGATELNPIMDYLMQRHGVIEALCIKLVISILLLSFIYSIGNKKGIDYNKYCRVGALIYIITFITGGILF